MSKISKIIILYFLFSLSPLNSYPLKNIIAGINKYNPPAKIHHSRPLVWCGNSSIFIVCGSPLRNMTNPHESLENNKTKEPDVIKKGTPALPIIMAC